MVYYWSYGSNTINTIREDSQKPISIDFNGRHYGCAMYVITIYFESYISLNKQKHIRNININYLVMIGMTGAKNLDNAGKEFCCIATQFRIKEIRYECIKNLETKTYGMNHNKQIINSMKETNNFHVIQIEICSMSLEHTCLWQEMRFIVYIFVCHVWITCLDCMYRKIFMPSLANR